MSIREIKVRGGQEISKLKDRILSARTAEMSDGALFREFNLVSRNGTGEGTAELTLARLRNSSNLFVASLQERERIVEIMKSRFPIERARIIEAADNILDGRFDLLGLRNVYFGSPTDWHLHPESGKRSPLVHWTKLHPLDPLDGGDPKLVWELNRHLHFVTLGQAYWLTNDSRYVSCFIDHATNWIDENPVGLGINWSVSLESAFRAISWLWALHFCADSPEITPDFIARLIKSLIEHGKHIERYLSYYFSPNTHLTGEALGLFYLGAALPELRRSEGWRELGLKILLEQLPVHVREDGVYFEQSSYYHRYTADFYIHLQALLSASGIVLDRESREILSERLEGLLDHLMWITRPDGTSPLFGDDDGGRLIKFGRREGDDFRDTLAIGAALYKRGDWKSVAGDAPHELLWLLGPDGLERYDEIKSEFNRNVSKEYPQSGYFVMRDGWDRDSSYALIDCGRHGSELGCGHAHSDALAIELTLRGVPWIVDPGTFIYAADPRNRDAFRSTEAHTTVVVDDQPQSITAGPFSWRTIADCSVHKFADGAESIQFEGSHNGYRRFDDPVVHTRSVTLIKADDAAGLPAHLFIKDSFEARECHSYSLIFHLTSRCRATVKGGSVEATHDSGEKLTISVIGKRLINPKVVDGWVSNCYSKRVEAPVAVFHAEGLGNQEFITLIFPSAVEETERLEELIFRHWRRQG